MTSDVILLLFVIPYRELKQFTKSIINKVYDCLEPFHFDVRIWYMHIIVIRLTKSDILDREEWLFRLCYNIFRKHVSQIYIQNHCRVKTNPLYE